jgi:competence protein ComEA
MKWFLAGLGVGVAFGIVMAPARGEESRRKLRETANQTWDEMSTSARDAFEQARSSEWGQRAAQAVDQARNSDWGRQATELASQARDRVSDVASQARQRVTEVAGKVRDQAPDRLKQTVDRVAGAAGVSGNEGSAGSDGGNGSTRGSLLELLNDASQDELIAVNGIGPVLALKIVQHRPYKAEEQPLEDNVIPPSAFEALRDHLKKSA